MKLLVYQVFRVTRISDDKVFAAKVIKRAKLEENKYKEKFVVRRKEGRMDELIGGD